MNTSLLDEVLFRRLGQSVHTRIRAALLKTGQTTQYGGYPDDGYYQKGIAKRYEVLTLGQYAGVTNIVLNGKTDVHSNNCVLDLNTGLMWSRYVSAGVGPASDGALPFTTNTNGEGIFSYMEVANTIGLSGYSDWRIPNIYELISIANYGSIGNCLPDIIAFPAFPAAQIRSATTNPFNTTAAIVMAFNTATLASQTKTASFKTILVRGGV